MKYEAFIFIPILEMIDMEKILAWNDGAHPDYHRDAVIKTYTADFNNGISAIIKVCNGDTPYVDSVLFEPTNQVINGITVFQEVAVLDVAENLEGVYHFEYNNNTYAVYVEMGNN